MSAILPVSAPAIANRRGRIRNDLVITLALLVAVVAWDLSGWDLAAAHAWGTVAGFAWKNHFLTRGVLHDGGRWLAFTVLAALVVNIWWPLVRGPSRAERVRWLAMTIVCLLAVPSLKQISQTSCPWDLAEFGGVARYVSHWQFALADGGPGRCFPSGHAVSAFGFIGGFFVLRHHHGRAARAWLIGVGVFGALFGWAQLARGAHYPSHTLWTAWMCWALCVLLAPRVRAVPAR